MPTTRKPRASAPPPSLLGALESALRSVVLTPADGAAVALAREYAKSIDELGAAAQDKLGGKLLDVLEALGMTPKARAALTKGAEPPKHSGLDELRARREKRAVAR